MKKVRADKNTASIVCDFFQKQERFRAIEKKFKAAKLDFYAVMKGVFDDDEKSKVFASASVADGNIVVKKVERVSVNFNAKKLRKKLPKKYAEQVITKRYVINDADNFLAYLRECGCDPDILRDFMQPELSVDKKALDRLHDIGEVSMEDIDGCYTVNVAEPYFTVERERNGNGQTE